MCLCVCVDVDDEGVPPELNGGRCVCRFVVFDLGVLVCQCTRVCVCLSVWMHVCRYDVFDDEDVPPELNVSM